MAIIGLRYFYYAPITTYTPGSAITYGTGAKIEGGARLASITWERNGTPFYGDDVIWDDDNSVTGYSAQMEMTGISNAERAALLGDNTVTGTGSTVTEYEITDASAPYVGWGFIEVKREKGVVSYEAYWFHRLIWGEDTHSANTKEQNITWNGPTLNARGTGVKLDSSGAYKFASHMNFTTESAALTWLKAKANVT